MGPSGDPREKGNLGGKYEAEPGRYRPITLHGASLSGHMHAAVQKVKRFRWMAGKWRFPLWHAQPIGKDASMSLGSDLGPHLPFLRRYTRALTGSQAAGDDLVRLTLEKILKNPGEFPRDVSPRLGLYWLLHRLGVPADPSSIGNDVGGNEGIANRRLAHVHSRARQALLLTAMEGFTPTEAGHILATSETEIEELVSEALSEIERQVRTEVLIIEDEPIIAMDIETIVRDLGHGIAGVAVTRAEAVSQATARRPGLVLADIQLADDSSGIDAVRDILAQMNIPVIFITAFPERLLTGNRPEPTWLVTKPFQRSTLKAAIAQALFFDSSSIPDPMADLDARMPNIELSNPETSTRTPSSEYSGEDFRSRHGPVDADVVEGQLRLSATIPLVATSRSNLEAVRRLHYSTARRISNMLAGSNIGVGFSSRLDAVRKSLRKELTEESVLQLAIQSRGLDNMTPIIHERLDEATALDVITFIHDVTEFAKSYPVYLNFMREAQNYDHITSDDQAILSSVSMAIEAQPTEAVDPKLREVITETRLNLEENRDPVAAFALLRSLGNLFRAIARYISNRGAGLEGQASSTFEKVGGRILGGAVAIVGIGGPIYLALSALAARFPGEFGFITDLVALIKGLF